MPPCGSVLVIPTLVLMILQAFAQEPQEYHNFNSPCYVVNAPGVVRPGQLYRVSVLVCGLPGLEEEAGGGVLYVRAALHKNGQQVAATQEIVEPHTLQILTLRTPSSLSQDSYSLTVEGQHPSSNLRFKNTTQLEFQNKFLSILIHTSRPIYRADQLVRFRVLMLRTDLRPYDDGLDVFIIDPDGFIMRRWLSSYTNIGVASLKFRLPKLANDGYWKIRVKAKEQIEEQKFKVETYFTPLFEVFVELPAYILDTDKEIVGKIFGISSTERMARGNVTAKLYVQSDIKRNETKKVIWEEKLFIKSDVRSVTIPMSRVAGAVSRLANTEITLEATMTETLFVMTAVGFSKSRIITSALNFRFLTSSPCYFKPGLPFHVLVAVSYEDNERVPAELLSRSTVKLKASYELDSGGWSGPPELEARGDRANVLLEDRHDSGPHEIMADPIAQESYSERGVMGFTLGLPHKARKLVLEARYSDEDGNEAITKLRCAKYSSPKEKYIRVTSTTENAVAGEYAVFHIKSNFKMSRCHYLIISKNYILNGGDVQVSDLLPTITTFPVTLSAEMAPGFKLLVFHVTEQQEVIADSVFLPVYAFRKYPMKLKINMRKDIKGDTIEVLATGDEGAFIGFHASRAAIYKLQAGNEITESRVADSLLSFEKFNRTLAYTMWQSRDGLNADQKVYYSSMDDGSDANSTFYFTGLKTFTHRPLSSFSEGEVICGGNVYTIPCASDGCFSLKQKCNGKSDCNDGSDEMNCPPIKDDNYEYRIDRISHFSDLYDADDGDWAWHEVKANDHKGFEITRIQAPFVTDDWILNGFTVSPTAGFSANPYPIPYSTKRPFIAHLSGADWCHRGEQVSIRLILQNHDVNQALVFVRLIGSPDYSFVHVEEGGVVSSYGARLTSGDHHLLVYIAPESQEQVDFPVAPTVEQGEVEVKFIASSQAAKSELSHTINVLPEGGIINRHTSIFLDLKNRAYVLNYMDITVEETPIVPYQEWRWYIYGSPKATLSVTGDIIGPAFPEIPMTRYSILGAHGKGTDSRMLEFAMNIWTLHYLRVTNRLSTETLKTVLEECTTIFAHIMKRFNRGGWFSNWDSSPPSVWLTAWVLRVFKHAVYADWENILYIDTKIFERGVRWLIKHQTQFGSFVETDYYYYPLDSKVKRNDSDISLTAHVLISLSECVELIEGSGRSKAVHAALRAAQHIEKRLTNLKDPYQLALAAYALTLAKNNERDQAFRYLQALMRQSTDGLYYWSRNKIPEPPTKLENQRAFVKPRLYHEGDSEAVETTAYALLSLLDKEGVTPLADKVVQWLVTMKMTSSGFVSATDTIVAIEALTEYTEQAGLIGITKIDVTINMATNADFNHKYHIGNTSQQDIAKIDNVWGHVNMIAEGAGLAIVQMDVSYGIDYEPLKDKPTYDSFELKIREDYSTERNKTAITIQSCLRWMREKPPVSGSAVLEIDIPSGYHLVENEAVAIAESGAHPTLRDAQTIPGKTLWFFDNVPKEWTCFNHTVKRWHPVANMTLYRQALLYELNARERFVQVLVNSTPLYVLNICEVCGSYQCPYCPYYNAASTLLPTTIFGTIIFLYIVNKTIL